MGQRVNIQYSIDIEKLPTEVTRLLESAYENLGDAHAQWVLDDVPISLETLEKIDKIRVRLADIDYLLNDVNQIINGYMTYKSQESAEPPPDTLSAPQVEGQLLQEQIEKFKNQLTHVEDTSDEIAAKGS
jgi:hypothetical protein